MNLVFSTLIPIALLAVVVVLVLGLWNMLRDGPGNLSQKFMRWRVVLQFVAVIVIMATVYIAKG